MTRTTWIPLLMILAAISLTAFTFAQEEPIPDVEDASAVDMEELNRLRLALLNSVGASEGLEGLDQEDDEPSLDELLAVADAVRPGLVQVEYTLQYDKGEPPEFYGGTQSGYGAGVIEQERPLEFNGFLISPTTVLSGDLALHPRFVESLAVRFGDDVVDAEIVAYVVYQDAVLLELARPLEGAEPLVFDAEAAGPYKVVNFVTHDAGWAVRVGALPTTAARPDEGQTFQASPANALIVGADGTPVAVSMDSRLPSDDSWKVSPLTWETVDAAAMAQLVEQSQQRADSALLRVSLNFRSPRKRPGLMSSGDDYSDEVGTERNVLGVLIGPRRLLVLENLSQKVTVRLERIQVHPLGADEPVEATFVGTLKDYGCLIADLAEPLDGSVALDTADIRTRRNRLLMLADVEVQGDNRVAYLLRQRIQGFYKGWQQNIYPAVPGQEDNLFLFSPEGALVALPVSRRLKTTVQTGWSSSSARLTAAAQLAAVLNAADLTENLDLNNIPLTEEEEYRLAWMGVALQPMTRELARIKQVAELTQDGQTGAIVSYIYPGSPADVVGVELGWILLRLDVEDEPRPLEVRASEYIWEQYPFPWDELDNFAVQQFEDAPPPWLPAENLFTRSLTDLGFGRKYTAQFFVEGEIVEKEFEVVESPPHYDSAAKFESEALGITVRDMTFETRRHFRKTEDDPGVIVSKIEAGTLADVARLKPFEIVTHVNDEPVHSVADFERLIADQPVLRLDVLRMTRGRVVKIETDVEEPEVPDDTLPELPDPVDAEEVGVEVEEVIEVEEIEIELVEPEAP